MQTQNPRYAGPCVGGPLDGEWTKARGPAFRVAQNSPFEVHYGQKDASAVYSEHVYFAETIDRGVSFFFRHESLSYVDALALIIKNYQGAKS